MDPTVNRRNWSEVVFAGLWMCAACAAPASAVQDATDTSRFVRVALTDGDGGSSTLVAVSEGAVEIDGWRYKALYQGRDGATDVIGFFAVRVCSDALVASIGAVWYGAPELASGPWSSEAFPELPASTAAAILKARFGMPDVQDVLWDVGELPHSTDPCDAAASEALSDGLLASDPLGAVLAPLAPESKSIMLSALADIGYPAVDAKPEVVDESERFHMLDLLRSVFEDWLSNWVPMPGAEHLLMQAALPKEIDMDAVTGRWRGPLQSVPSPCRPTWYSSWEPLDPLGEMCGCTTTGPISHCVEVTITAGGSLDVWVPFPKPVGSWVTVYGSANMTTAVMVCGWSRSCRSPMVRTRSDYLPPDCEPRLTSQFKTLTVQRWTWWPPQMNPDCDDMQCLNQPPPGTPTSDEPCGLGDEVITSPPPRSN